MKRMLLLWVLCQAFFASAQNCSVIYVNIDAPGASDGSSWQDAFTNLQDAITESANCLDVGAEIWVAQGTYLPDVGETQVAGNRYATFYLLDNVQIFGGFTGAETTRDERDWQVNETVLSGDVGAPGDSTDNIYNIVTAYGNTPTAIINGFTIRDGNASEMGVPFEDPTRSGGGLFNILGSPTIRNCTFRNNTARYYGAGVYTEDGDPLFEHCKFLQNNASSGGGGLYSKNGAPKLSRCTFIQNESSSGGALSLSGGAPELENCTIQGNTASFGGGIYTRSDAVVLLVNCVISGNHAGFGGGVNNGAEMSFYNCTIANNQADGRGGGIESVLGNILFVNCILWANTSANEGKQIRNANLSNIVLSHTCYANGVNDVFVGGGFTPDANCITTNPLFVAPAPIATAPNTVGDYRLRAISTAINAGDNLAIAGVVTDLDDNLRIANGLVDMGAYELQTTPASCPGGNRLYVNAAAPAGGSGTSWATAFKHLQDALMTGAGCTNISEIWVARGIYLPDRGEGFVAGDRDATFQMHNNLAVYGGFAGNETTLEQRNWTTFVSILSGDIGTVDILDNNSYTIVFASSTDNSAVIDGFTIRDGQAVNNATLFEFDYPRWCGGGIYIEGGSPGIRNCTFINNQAGSSGGSIYNKQNSKPLISHCTFLDNTALRGSGIYNEQGSNAMITDCVFTSNEGAAIYNANSSAIISRCFFSGNNASFGGGVFNISDSVLVIDNCVFAGNTAGAGGAIFNQGGSFSSVNCLFSGNKASHGGAVSNLGETSQTYTNCTFSGNQASSQGGAIRNQGVGNGTTILNNCIIWGNYGGNNGNQIQSDGNIEVSLFASCYANGVNDIAVSGSFNTDANCTTENPLFISPVLPLAAPTTTGNYRLSPCSPLINEGNNGLIPFGTLTDLDQEVRIISGLVDLGAYEFRDTQNVQLPQISLDVVQPACSNIPGGSASAIVTSGAMPYTYLWSGGQTTPELTNLAPGDYVLTVTDNSGCKASVGFSITAPAPIESTTVNIQDALCGIQNGQASIVVNGGTPPYTYLWSGGQTESVAIGLPGGIQTVSITDANGCVHTDAVSIDQSDAVEASITGVLLVSCLGNDGRLSVQSSGGSGTLSYLWSNDETTETINGLSVGDYSVTVTDSLGCTAVVTTPLGAQAPFESQLVSIENISCNGLADGQATVTPVNGIAPFSYLWDDGQTMATAENLVPGLHSVTLTEGQGCTTTRSVTITEPLVLEASITGFNPVSCLSNNSGQATALGMGGTDPYDYLWSDGQETAQATGLEAGNYTVEVTDANGCTATISVTILAPQLPQAVIAATQNASACIGNDGSASVAVSGGQVPYTYLWSNGQTLPTATGLIAGSYTVVATDAGGCTATASASITSPPAFESEITNLENAICNGVNDGTATVSVSGGLAPYTYSWDNGQITATATGLSPGQHAVVVTDANGCTTGKTITITASVAILTTVSLQAQNNCFGDANATILVIPSNGVGPYVFLWSNGTDTPGISNLPAGTYFVSITDSNGCRAVAGAIITEPELLMLTANGTNGLCGNANNGSATAQGSGGTPPYNYLWSDGQTTATALDLEPGTYTATVTDAHDCTATASVNVTAPQPLVASIANAQQASCVDEADGSSGVQVSGGIVPYTYLWSDGQTTATAIGLLPGNYSVVILDANNCTVEVPVVIGSAVPALNANIVLDGATLSAIQGGAQYQWIDCNTTLPVLGATTQTFQPEISGNYAAVITVGTCNVQSSCINVIVTSLEGELPVGKAPLQVFPNPNSGLFSLILPEAAIVLLFNAAGSKLWQNQFLAGRHEIDRQVLPSGVYWLHAIRSNKVETVKIVVE